MVKVSRKYHVRKKGKGKGKLRHNPDTFLDITIGGDKKSLAKLENLIASYLNGKITKRIFEIKYRNYCELRDM